MNLRSFRGFRAFKAVTGAFKRGFKPSGQATQDTSSSKSMVPQRAGFLEETCRSCATLFDPFPFKLRGLPGGVPAGLDGGAPRVHQVLRAWGRPHRDRRRGATSEPPGETNLIELPRLQAMRFQITEPAWQLYLML